MHITFERPQIKVASFATHRPGDMNVFPIAHATLHVYEYEGNLFWNEERIDIHPGSVILMAPGQTTRYQFSGISRHGYLHFLWDFPIGFTQLALHDQPEITQRVLKVILTSADSRLAAEIKLHDLLHDLFRDTQEDLQTDEGHRRARRMQQFILRNLSSSLSLSAVSSQVELSPNQANRVFSEAFGTTIGEYIKFQRLSTAYDLIMNTTHPIKRIAYECGIGDLQYFSKLISRRFGCSPRELRQRESLSRAEAPFNPDSFQSHS